MKKTRLFLPNIKDGGGVGEYSKWIKKEFPKIEIETINEYHKQTNIKLLMSLILDFLNIFKRSKRNRRFAQS